VHGRRGRGRELGKSGGFLERLAGFGNIVASLQLIIRC